MADITIYSTSTCPYCEMEKDYLSQHGIAYRDVQVDRDPQGLEEMLRVSGQLGVPFTVIKTEQGEERILGFDRARLDQALGF